MRWVGQAGADRQLGKAGASVILIDLDIVTPYFGRGR